MNLSAVKSSPRFRGRTQLIAHLAGKRVTCKGAILAKCYECNGGYVDGLVDCGIPECPLYPHMPANPAVVAKRRDSAKDQPREVSGHPGTVGHA